MITHIAKNSQERPKPLAKQHLIDLRQNAYHLLNNNAFKDHLLSICAQERHLPQSAGNQIKHALLGSGVQCEKCYKFFSSRKSKNDHRQKCRVPGFQYRVPFDQIDGQYYCYYGCG